jgi:hypothetical protein
VKQALQTILKAGSTHPPSLPEFLAYARSARPTPPPREEAICSPAEIAINRWFVHRSLRLRFVGMNYDDHFRLRREVLALAEQLVPHMDATDQADVAAAFDVVAERIYPERCAREWLADPAITLESLRHNAPHGGPALLRHGRSAHYGQRRSDVA